MSAEETITGVEESAPTLRLNKKIIPFEEGSPDEEPLFVNCFQVAKGGGVAYIDVGVIPLDELLSQPQVSATFLVLTRLVMSMEALTNLRDQIDQLLGHKGNTLEPASAAK
jgi:hypothetical protein